ncbi:DUF4175 domain-containing protein [Xinfangfangia sp. CPCC 101601]|uniref:DUF4175 domain-containing protein n=1 Tax=Pseudogemmobacter lacusdianii TaxID=3069608 RepID=A0ABU0VZP1_9RHOB|nr:DUF4175 domain-containing protein [Xinfangfangia sp. CPCC 101601]MDQ2066360.1 DUF4175 domain-containing protein [Xinfangfangia sp. CPCC 101601]
MTGKTPPDALKALVWPLRLTKAGLWAERIVRAFWPLWTLVLLSFSALAFGLQDLGPLFWVQIAAGIVGLAALALAAWGWWQFRRPTEEEAVARLDASLPGRPLAALRDSQAIGADDPASLAVWRAHLRRMAERAKTAKPVAPDLQLSSRDPYALRYVALIAAVMAAMFGSLWQVSSVVGLAPGPAVAAVAGPSWEGWAKPPSYTGKPSIYLGDVTAPELELPVGSQIQIRFYGTDSPLSIDQSIAQVAPEPAGAEGSEPMAGVTKLVVSQSGELAIDGPGGRRWQIIATPDAAPMIEVMGEMKREADGRFKQSFKARDDYGVTAGRVEISLDLDKVSRRYGLSAEPEAIAPVTLDLPMPMKGGRKDFTEVLLDDLSKSLLSNMPVSMVFTATDAAGQEGHSAPYEVVLHGRRFFDPVAAAVIEMRRDLLWSRSNAPRVSDVLKAISHRPEDLIRSQRAALHLRVALRELDKIKDDMTSEQREAMAETLWNIALMFEEGDLASAMERLQRAQDRLEEAIRNGASPEEIEQLMKELQQAMKDYTRELGEQAQRDPSAQGQGESREITGDQLQQMLDEIERLMKEGKTAEAMALMEQLRQLMENLQVQQGQGGEGDGDGDGPMRELGDTLKDQQGLSDDAYRDMQRGRSGQEPGQDPGELAERQRELRDRLGQLQDQELPGDGSEKGEAGRDALEGAARSMEEAERALEEGDLDSALDHQADALEAMREGMKDFGEALAEERREGQEPGGSSQAERTDPNGRDPLGREPGDGARIGSDRNMVQNTPDQRAQELTDEIRRRSGQTERPAEELDYLKRLLELF